MGYRKAQRLLWKVEDEVLGFYKAHGPLAQLVVRNAGHMVPHDRPDVAQLMIQGFVMQTLNQQSRHWPPRDEARDVPSVDSVLAQMQQELALAEQQQQEEEERVELQ